MRRLLILSLLLAFLTTGCIDIEIHTKIQSNGSGVQTWRFSGTALLASQIEKQIENNPFFAKAITRDEYKEGNFILESSIPFQDVSELRNFDRDVHFRSEGWLMKTNTYTEVWKGSGKAGGFLTEQAKGIVPITLKITVQMPGRVTESNADSFEDSTAYWTVPVSDLASSKILTVTSRSMNWLLFIVIAVLLFGIMGGFIFFVYSTAKKPRLASPDAVACASCGARVPAGSAFCNFCGKTMAE